VKVENLWLEVSHSTTIIIGGIYRHANRSMLEFIDAIDLVLSKISSQNIPCIIAGDINIDLTKCRINNQVHNYKVELVTVADCQSSLHRLVTSIMSASPSTVVCTIPGEMEEGERRHHIIANYYDDDSFNMMVRNTSKLIDISVFHLNIRNFNSHSRGLCQYLSLLSFSFDIRILSGIGILGFNVPLDKLSSS